MRILCPPELGDNQVFLAHNPGGEVFNGDALAAFKLSPAIRGVLANEAIHFDDAFLMDEVEQRFVSDGTADGLAGNVIVGREQLDNGVRVFRCKRDDEINIPGHARLSVVIHRHRPGEHESKATAFQPG